MEMKWAIVLVCALGLTRAQSGYSRDNPINQLGYNPFGQAINDEDAVNGDEIPGEAGRDYPVYAEVPQTGFSCDNQQFPGYYADPEAQCQAFYICQRGGKSDSFLCPNGTVFNQEFLVCDWWYNFDCSRAEQFYSVNEMVVRAMEEADARLRQQQSGYNYNAPGSDSSNGGYQGGYSVPQGQGSQGTGQSAQRPSSTYGTPSNRRTNINFNGYNTNGNSNGRNTVNNISPVYGVPGQQSGSPIGQSSFAAPSRSYSGNGVRGNNNYTPSNQRFETARRNGNQPSQNYGVPNSSNGRLAQGNSFNGNNNGYNRNSISPVYGTPSDSITVNAPGIQYSPQNGGFNGNGNNGYRNENAGATPDRTYLPPTSFNNGNNGFNNGNGQSFRNGLGNLATSPDRTYLPPTGNAQANSSPSSQYAATRPDSSFGRFNEPNAYNGIAQGYSPKTPDRSYLPPSQ